MITVQRLERTAYGRGLLYLFDRLVPYQVKDWGNDDSGDKANNRASDREVVFSVREANVISSKHREGDPFGVETHAVLLDIDHPAWLMPSTTPGHYHLYIDVPGGIEHETYMNLLDTLANCRIIEHGYAGASRERGFTSLRFPWIEKDKSRKVPD